MEWKMIGITLSRWSQDRKNLLMLIVILTGLFFGSLFVDLGQLITGHGFSGPAIRSHDILVTGGKTWVGYTEPKVRLRIVNDSTCPDCDPAEALLWLRRIVPTLEAERIEVSSDTGRALVDAFQLVTVPAFLFDETVKETEFYTQAQPLFHANGKGTLLFDMNMIGMPIGRYLKAPETNPSDIVIGAQDAPVTMIVFSDFQCQYCREYHATYKRLLSEYGSKLRIVWKHLPLPIHAEAKVAARAAQCAGAQSQFLPYADLLFARQSEWGKSGGERQLRNYAWQVRGIDGRAFARCLDDEESLRKVNDDLNLAADFHIDAAPTTFVNQQFISGAAPYEDIKALIESALHTREQ